MISLLVRLAGFVNWLRPKEWAGGGAGLGERRGATATEGVFSRVFRIFHKKDNFSISSFCRISISGGFALLVGLGLTGCVQPWHEVQPLQAKKLEKLVNGARTLVLSVTPEDARLMMTKHNLPPDSKREIILGSAAPVAPDGWFLTADHVVNTPGKRQVVVIYNIAGARRYGTAKVVWHNAGSDLALIKAEMATPDYYRFTPRDRDLPPGTRILHAGITTGNKAQIGELSTEVSGRGKAGFEHTLRLAPGDSGGPVIVFSGELVGVNSAVGLVSTMDTTFFSSSRSSRPDPEAIMNLISHYSPPHP